MSILVGIQEWEEGEGRWRQGGRGGGEKKAGNLFKRIMAENDSNLERHIHTATWSYRCQTDTIQRRLH